MDRLVLHFQRQINIIQIEKEKCGRKIYPYEVCSDMNDIPLRANGALVRSL